MGNTSLRSVADPYQNIGPTGTIVSNETNQVSNETNQVSAAIKHAMRDPDGRGFVLAKLKGKSATAKQTAYITSQVDKCAVLSNLSYTADNYKTAMSSLIEDAIEANNITQFRMYYKLYRSAGFKLSTDQKEDLEKAAAFTARAAMLEETEKYHLNERIFSAGEISNEAIETAEDTATSFYDFFDKIKEGLGRAVRWAVHSRIIGAAVAVLGFVVAGYQLKSALSAASNLYDYIGAGTGFGETAGTSAGYGFVVISKFLSVTPLVGSIVLFASAISGVVSSAMEYLSLRKEYQEAKELFEKEADPKKENKLDIAKVLMNTAGKKAIAGIGLSLVFLAAAVAFIFPALVGALLGGLSTAIVYGLCIGAGVLATGMKWLAGKFFDRTEEKALARIEADDPTNHPEVHFRSGAEVAAETAHHVGARPADVLTTTLGSSVHSDDTVHANLDELEQFSDSEDDSHASHP